MLHAPNVPFCPGSDRNCPILDRRPCSNLLRVAEIRPFLTGIVLELSRIVTLWNSVGVGFDSRRLHHSPTYEDGQNPDKSGQNRAYLGHTPEVASEPPAATGTLPDQNQDKSGQKKCQTSVKRIPPDLAELEELWPTIPEAVRASLLSLAKAAVAGKTSTAADDGGTSSHYCAAKGNEEG